MSEKSGNEKKNKSGKKHGSFTNETHVAEDIYTSSNLPRFDPDGFWDGETIYDD